MTNAFRVRLHGDQCVYCGERANSDEHFPPASYGNRGFLLPACRECNSWAGTAHPLNFIKRAEIVKQQIKSHAPRFTFTTDVTLQDILSRPESVWLSEMRAEKLKATYRNRYNWDAMAYVVSIQTRRYKFVIDFTDDLDAEDGPSNDAEFPRDDENDTSTAATENIDARVAMDAAHREELLESLLENLPKVPATRTDECLLDEDMEFLSGETYFGRHLTPTQFERLLNTARQEAVFTDPDDIRRMDEQGLIDFVKSLGISPATYRRGPRWKRRSSLLGT